MSAVGVCDRRSPVVAFSGAGGLAPELLPSEWPRGRPQRADPPPPGRHPSPRHGLLPLQLKDENAKLRRKLTEVQSFSETQTEM